MTVPASQIAASSQALNLEVIAADSDIIIVNKPSGLLSVPGRALEHSDSVQSRLARQFGESHMAHRLDMATSGLMVVARHKQALRGLNQQFANRQTSKKYIAEVFGQPKKLQGQIQASLICDWPNRPRQIVSDTGKSALTYYRVIETDATRNKSRVELQPITGRSHQLRVHMQYLGHPILGDEFYAHVSARGMANRLLLHAQRLGFTHPSTGQALQFSIDADF